jgi:hypothetical protein
MRLVVCFILSSPNYILGILPPYILLLTFLYVNIFLKISTYYTKNYFAVRESGVRGYESVKIKTGNGVDFLCFLFPVSCFLIPIP